MKKATFYISKKSGEASIYIQLKWGGTGFATFTGKKVDARLWDNDPEIQRPKNTKATKGLSDTLDKIEEVALKALQAEQNKPGIPDPKVIKAAVDQFCGKKVKHPVITQVTLQGVLNLFWIGEVKNRTKDHRGEPLSLNTRRCYKKLSNHIKEYDKTVRKSESDFGDIDATWWNDYKEHFEYLAPNSIAADLQALRSALNYATKKGHNTKMDYKNDSDIYANGEEVESGYLNREEIAFLNEKGGGSIYSDFFILGCETGARFSDWDKFNKFCIYQIKGTWFFTYTAQKTGIKARVLCSPLFLSIYLDKHNQLMPKVPPYKAANAGIKAACAKAGLREITPHESRRSFCTNHYLEGMNPKEIMRMSGHKTEKAFNAYIKVTLDESGELQIKHAAKLQKEMAAAK